MNPPFSFFKVFQTSEVSQNEREKVEETGIVGSKPKRRRSVVHEGHNEVLITVDSLGDNRTMFTYHSRARARVITKVGNDDATCARLRNDTDH